MRSNVRRRSVALVAATFLVLVGAAGVVANSPNPGSINASVDGSTVTVAGTWTWGGIDKCDDHWVGWAIDWDDPSDPGNAVKNGFSVGAANDNSVHTSSNCGSAANQHDRQGTWGSLSHTYPSSGTYKPCVVMYDVHLDKGRPQDLVAGGDQRNRDNSVESNGQAPTSPGCTSVTIASPAQIRVRKAVNKTTADPGDTLTYTITLSNSGGKSGKVDVTDNISALLAKGSFQGTSGGGSLSGSTVSWSGVTVAGGQSTSLTISVRLNTGGWPSGQTTLTNTVVVPGTNCASGANDSACRTTTTVTPRVNLVVRKTVNKSTAGPGDTLTYTINIQNTGGADATGVSASDNIASLLAKGTFQGASNGGSLNGSAVTWSGLAINAGSSVNLGLSVKLNSTGWSTGTTTFNNSVVVANSNCASGSSDASCKVATTVHTAPNLVVSKTVNATGAHPGDTLTYTLTVRNTGNGDATGVDINDNISALLAKGKFVSASNGGVLNGSTVSWSNLAIVAGASSTGVISVRLNATGWSAGTATFPNTVVVPNSNCSSGSSNADCKTNTTVVTKVDLNVRKTVNRSTADPGDTLTYTIKIDNAGDADASNVSVSDNISSLLAKGAFLSASDGGSVNGSTVSWSGLSIVAGASQTLSLSVKLNSSGWGTGTTTFTNTVVVPNSNCASGNGSGSCRATTTVETKPRLVVRKTVDSTTAHPGDVLTYTITIDNQGNGDATGVKVTDNIGALLDHGAFGGASGGSSLSGSTLSWTGLSVDAGATRTVTYGVRLDGGGWASGTTTLPNTVVVANSDCASGSTKSSCRTSTTVTAESRLSVRKTVNTSSAAPGETLTYTITIQNSGNSAATGVNVSDPIAALLAHGTFTSASLGGTLSGTIVRWTNLSIGAGATQSLSFGVKLDVGGWSGGVTNLPNTVVVAGSDCASGATNANCSVIAPVTPRFAVSVTKGVGTRSSGPFAASVSVVTGDVVWYQIKVANGGNATLSGVKVTDSQGIPASQCTTVPTTLAPGASWSCAYFRSAARGTVVNKVTVDTDQTAAQTVAATVTALEKPAPAIGLALVASAASLPVGGGSVTLTFTVTNPGNVPLSSVSVSDDHCAPLTRRSGDSNGNSKLDPGEAWRYTCALNLTVTTSNTASATGMFGSTKVSTTARGTVTVIVAEPGLHLEKTARPAQLPVSGGQVTYTYVVSNVGSQPLSSLVVTDDRCTPVRYGSGDTNGNSRLDLTETWRFTCTVKLSATTTNHARATGSFSGTSVHDDDQATVEVASSEPAIHVVTAANPTTLPAGGGSVTYTYVVTNHGNTPLTNVSVVDNRCSNIQALDGDTNGNDRLDQNETWQYRCVTNVTATTTSTATATGHAGGVTVSDTDQATVAVTATTAAINVTTSAQPISLPSGGGAVTYSYLVTNKGNVALLNVTVADDVCDPVSFTGGDTNSNKHLDPTETWTYTCATTLAGTTTNTALATGFSGGLPVTDTDQALVTVGTPAVHTPRVGLTVTASSVDLPATGGPVTFTYTVVNKGDVPLSDVTVTDDGCSPIDAPAGDANADHRLDLTETWTFSCMVTLIQTTTSTATVTATYNGQKIEALDIATVTVAAAPRPPPSQSPGDGSVPGDSGPGSSVGPGGSGGAVGPGGSVAGATSPPKESANPDTSASVNTGTTPSAMVMILILLLGVAAAVVIMTLSKRTSS